MEAPQHTASRTTAPQPGVPGRWGTPPEPISSAPRLELDADEIAALEAIGYAGGSTAPPYRTKVTKHDAARAWPGLNFYTSGHAPVAILMDMEGRVLHEWRKPMAEVFPERWIQVGDKDGANHWRRAYLFENGDVLVILGGFGMFKIDVDSNLLWKTPDLVHHNAHVLPDGDIATLARQWRVIPHIDPQQPVLEDLVARYDSQGRRKHHVSVLEALERSPYIGLWDGQIPRSRDLFHTNWVQVLDGRLAHQEPAFQAGRVLVSMRSLDAIGVIDLDLRAFVWALKGDFKLQHDPRPLANGHLLLFDNLGRPGRSSVLELDPASDFSVAWRYGGLDGSPLFTASCGTATRLPNGNTLITETERGRALEVTAEKELVWEFLNPERAGPKNEFIAAIFEVTRLPADFPHGWARPPE
jgi:hypothetical protein